MYIDFYPVYTSDHTIDIVAQSVDRAYNMLTVKTSEMLDDSKRGWFEYDTKIDKIKAPIMEIRQRWSISQWH